MKKPFLFAFLTTIIGLLNLSVIALAQNNPYPKRVLITNDNGIDDPKMHALARAFAKVSETYVSASLQDRTGTTHYVSQNRKYEVERRFLGEGIIAYGVDGTPAEA